MAWTSPVRWRLKSSIGMTWLYPPPAAPPLIPKTGPSDGWRMQTAAFRPIRLRPWASPTVVVDLPSPSGVGLIAVTTTYLPRGFAASSRSIPARVTLALVCPYGSISSPWRPRSWATSMIGRGVTARAISRSDGKLIGPLVSRRRRPPRRPPARQPWQAASFAVLLARWAGRRPPPPGRGPLARDGPAAARWSAARHRQARG